MTSVSIRVLIVDDNPDLRESLGLLLARLGYDSEGARDGQPRLGPPEREVESRDWQFARVSTRV